MAVLLRLILYWAFHRYAATLSALLINILLHSFQLFSWRSALRGWNNLFSGVCQSGGCIIHAGGGGGFTHLFGQTALMCNRRRPAATSSRRASFSALASANSRVFCIERSNITLTHLHVSNCRVRRFSLQHFCRAGLCRQWRYHGND